MIFRAFGFFKYLAAIEEQLLPIYGSLPIANRSQIVGYDVTIDV